MPPTNYTGLLRFSYRLYNSEGTDDATVTLAVGERPVAGDIVYDVLGNVGISVPEAAGLLANNSGDRILPVSLNHVNGAGGWLEIGSATGSVMYTPATGSRGTDEYFYTIQNGFGSSRGTLTFKIEGMFWFVDENATAAGNGRLSTPFASLAAFVAAGLDEEGDVIFLHESATPYTGGITLKDGQRLIGQDASQDLATLAGVTVPPYSHTLPEMNRGAGDEVVLGGPNGGVVLGSDNRLHGFRIDVTSGDGLYGDEYGTLVARDVSVESGGRALYLNDGTADVEFISTTSRGGLNGVHISKTDGTLALGSGSIQGATGYSLQLFVGSADITYAGSITNTNGYTLLSQVGRGGTVVLSGPVDAGGQGIYISEESRNIVFSGPVNVQSTGIGIQLDRLNGGRVSFTGGLDIEAPTGISATGSGELEVIGAANTISATTGAALDIHGVDIGPGGLNIANLISTGGTSGVILSGTSGGAVNIANTLMSDPGILIDDISNEVSFGFVQITSRRDVGIDINNATAPISFGDVLIGTSALAVAPAINLNGAAHVTIGHHNIDMADVGTDVDAIVLRSSKLEMTGGTVRNVTGNAFAIASVSKLRLTDVIVENVERRGIQSAGGQIDLSGVTLDLIGGAGIFLNDTSNQYRLRVRDSRIGATGQATPNTWVIQTTARYVSVVLEDVTFGPRDNGVLSIQGEFSSSIRCVAMTNVIPDDPLKDPEYIIQGSTPSPVQYWNGGGVVGNISRTNVEDSPTNQCFQPAF